MSGGQKARLALARAVYARNRIVIMDDVLSALDSGTSRTVYEKCLVGPLMKDRTVILVTHHLDLVLAGAAYLVRVVDGQIDCAGTPEELRSQGMLEKLIATEEAEIKADEPVAAQAEVGKEVEALEGGPEPKVEDAKPKTAAKKLIAKEEQRFVCPRSVNTYECLKYTLIQLSRFSPE